MVFVDRSGLKLVASDPSHEAWQISLDRIELDVVRAEIALANGSTIRTDEWDVPADHGPLPADLRPRAEEILARQQVVMTQMAEQLGTTLRQQAVVDRVGRASTRHHVPIYVDVSA